MRYININFKGLNLPQNWRADSTRLKNQLLAEPDPKKRAKIIEDNQSHWKKVKKALAETFNHKCWYTEAPQQGTDVDVDHFRPKKRVQETLKETVPHEGYWWLAFDIENYRYSCIVANRRRTDVESGVTGGKADYFPLLEENDRAWKPSDCLASEQPVLLDPLKVTDTQLIVFKEDGEAMPRYDEKSHARKFLRADKSIDLYNINHSDFVRRRIELRDEIDRLVKAARLYFNKLENSGDALNDFSYEEAIYQLRKMRSASSPFSSFCVSYLDTFRHKPEYDGVLDGVFQ